MSQNAAEMLEKIANGTTDLVIDYVAQGGAPDTVANGNRLIGHCAYYGDVTAIKYLMAQGETLEPLGKLAVTDAAFFGHHRLCQFLIEHGFDPNAALPETGETALHAATSKLDQKIYDDTLRVLLAGGANPNVTTTPGVETLSLMRDVETRGETPLHRAAAFGSEASIRILLDGGAAVDAKDARGETPLGWASWHRRPAAILGLLCYGRFVGTIRASHIEADRNYRRCG